MTERWEISVQVTRLVIERKAEWVYYLPGSRTFVIGNGAYLDVFWLIPPDPPDETISARVASVERHTDWWINSGGWVSPKRKAAILAMLKATFPEVFEEATP